MEARNIIVRHHTPNVMDEAPLGSLCMVKKIKDMDLYLQTNNNPEAPFWEYITNVQHGTNPDVIDRILEDRMKTL